MNLTTPTSRRKLNQLRMLADWQLTNLGYDVAGVTAACLALDDAK